MYKLSQDNDNDSTSSDLGAVVLEKEPEVKEPPSYQVVLINDDYPFALIKFLDKNFVRGQIFKSKNASFKINIPEWLKI